jgi:hypothetical protein
MIYILEAIALEIVHLGWKHNNKLLYRRADQLDRQAVVDQRRGAHHRLEHQHGLLLVAEPQCNLRVDRKR